MKKNFKVERLSFFLFLPGKSMMVKEHNIDLCSHEWIGKDNLLLSFKVEELEKWGAK